MVIYLERQQMYELGVVPCQPRPWRPITPAVAAKKHHGGHRLT
jgi:hypothetical protein